VLVVQSIAPVFIDYFLCMISLSTYVSFRILPLIIFTSTNRGLNEIRAQALHSAIPCLKKTSRKYEGRPESKDRLAIKKNKQNKNKIKFNVSLLQTLSYFST
jgi:hypothetical protein